MTVSTMIENRKMNDHENKFHPERYWCDKGGCQLFFPSDSEMQDHDYWDHRE